MRGLGVEVGRDEGTWRWGGVECEIAGKEQLYICTNGVTCIPVVL